MSKTTNRKAIILLSIAFIEGATVMAAELLGAKMTAPFFGTTIYSWAAVLAVTLGGLASGYYFGGWISTRKNHNTLLSIILLASGIFMVFMPMISAGIMTAVINMSLLSGLIISLMIFLFPVVFLFGMVSPIIISAMVDSVSISGKIAGKVYAISTVGGVLNTLILGFYIIPTYGIKWPSVAYGLLMIFVALLFMVTKKKMIYSLVILFITVIAIKIQSTDKSLDRQLFEIKYSSEGLLGQVKVVDYSIQTNNYGVVPVRGLLVNNTWQTVINLNDGTGMLDYIYFIRPILSKFSPGSKTLLIGLGGGTLCQEIQSKQLSVEVVELDSRLPKIAKKHFGLDYNTKVTSDDGRHFLRKSNEKYDLIIFDAFLGENPPWHLLTFETFAKVKSMLNEGGNLVIEFYGFLEGDNGMAGRSLFATLQEVGFNVDVVATAKEDGIERNFVYIAGDKQIDYSKLDYSGIKYTEKDISNLAEHTIASSEFLSQEYLILTDDTPALEDMLMKPALEWRNQLNEHFRNRFVSMGQPIFY